MKSVRWLCHYDIFFFFIILYYFSIFQMLFCQHTSDLVLIFNIATGFSYTRWNWPFLKVKVKYFKNLSIRLISDHISDVIRLIGYIFGINVQLTFDKLDDNDFDQRSRSQKVTGQGQMFPELKLLAFLWCYLTYRLHIWNQCTTLKEALMTVNSDHDIFRSRSNV